MPCIWCAKQQDVSHSKSRISVSSYDVVPNTGATSASPSKQYVAKYASFTT